MRRRVLSVGALSLAMSALLSPIGSASLPGATAHAAAASVSATAGSVLLPIGPARLARTSVPANGTVTVQVTGVGGVPAADVTAVALSVTATSPAASGALTVFPAGTARRAVTTLSFYPGLSRTSGVVVQPGEAGRVAVFNGSTAAVTVTLDVQAWAAAPGTTTSGSTFVPLSGARLLDSTSGGGSAVAPRTSRTLDVTGVGGVPASAVSSVTLAVTALAPASAGSLTVHPAGTSRPDVTAVSFPARQTSTSQVTVRPGSGGMVALYNGSSGSTHLLVDVVGYTRPAGTSTGSTFVPVTPKRIVDTASAIGTTGPVPARGTATFPGRGAGPIPSTGVSAVLMSVTTRQATASGSLTAHAAGTRRPGTVSSSFTAGRSETQLVVVRPGSSGQISVYNGSSGSTHLRVDVLGYFGPDGTAPPAVGAPTVTTTTSSARLAWTNPTTPDFAGVVVRRAVGSTPPASATSGTAVKTMSRSSTVFTNAGLASGTTYSWSLFAIDGARNASPAATATATTALDPVTGLGSSGGSTSVALSWTNPSGPALRGVVIRRAVGTSPPATSADGELVADVAAPGSSWTDTGRSPSTSYAYALFAHDGAGRYSSPATTSATTTAPPPDTTPPGSVSSLTAAAHGADIRLTWTNPSDADLAGVDIRRRSGTTAPTSPTSGTLVGRADVPATTFDDVSVTAGQTYSYAVFARDGAGNRSGGTTATATAPTKPEPVHVCGRVTSDQTWGPTRATVYILDCPVTVDPRVTLTWEPGVVVKAAPVNPSSVGPGIIVNGTLTGIGTAAKPLVVTSLHDDSVGGDTGQDGAAKAPARADWGGITATPVAGTTPPVIRLTQASLSYGRTVSSRGSSTLELRSSTLRQMSGTAVDVSHPGGGSVLVEGNTVSDIGRHGMSIDSGNTAPTVRDNAIQRTFARALQVSSNQLDPTLLTGNTGSGNQYDAMLVSGTLVKDLTLPMAGLPWVIAQPVRDSIYGGSEHFGTGRLVVPPRTTMTLGPGAVLKLDDSCYSPCGSVEVQGSFRAVGTASAPAVVTSLRDDAYGGDVNGDGSGTRPAAGDWGALTTSPQTGAPPPVLELDNAVVGYGQQIATAGTTAVSVQRSTLRQMSLGGLTAVHNRGGSVLLAENLVEDVTGDGLRVTMDSTDPASSPTVRDNTVNRVTGRAIRVSGPGLLPAQLLGNSGASNQLSVIEISGTMVGDLTLPTPGLAWVVSGVWSSYPYSQLPQLVVAPGATLRLGPGAVLKFGGPCGTSNYHCNSPSLLVQGTLDSRGTAAQPAVLTSLRDDTVGGDSNGDGAGTLPTRDDWHAVHVIRKEGAAAPTALLEHTHLRYGRGITATGLVDLTVRDSVLEKLSGPGVSTVDFRGPGLKLERNRVRDLPGHGVSIQMAVDEYEHGPTISHNVFTGVRGRAIFVNGANIVPSQIVSNTGSGNQYNVVSVTGTLAGDLTLPAAGLTWAVGGTLNIGLRSTLTLDPGGVLKMGPCNEPYSTCLPQLRVYGALRARGTAAAPAYITSIRDDAVGGGDDNGDSDGTVPTGGDWGTVMAVQTGVSSAAVIDLDHAVIRYGLSLSSSGISSFTLTNSRVEDMWANAVTVPQIKGGTVVLENNTVKRVFGDGILVTMDPTDVTTAPTVRNNHVQEVTGRAVVVSGPRLLPTLLLGNTGTDNRFDVLEISGTLAGDLTLPTPGLPWVVGWAATGYSRRDGRLTIAPHTTMTLLAGATLKFEDQCRTSSYVGCGGLVVSGTLRTTGSASAPAVLTSLRDDTAGGDTNGDADATVPAAADWTSIAVAPVALAPAPVVDLQGVVIRYAATALSVPSGDARVTGTIEHDTFGIAGPPRDEDGACTAGLVTAEDVYWGTSTGPAPYGSGPGVSGCVDVEPWSATRPGV